MIKLAIVGAGSVVFSGRLISDLTLTEGLKKSRAVVALMDVNEDRLNAIYNLAKRCAKERGAKLVFEKTFSRKKALSGADFVINTAFIPGYRQMEAERKIAEQHGYYRGIGDNVSDYYGSIGAYWQLRFFLELARDMERFCPKAWLLQTANPVFEGCTLIGRESTCKVIGMCHGYARFLDIMDALNINYEEVDFQVAGFNHCIWLTRFRVKGENGYSLLDRWLAEEAPRFWSSEEYMFEPRNYQLSPAAFAMYKFFGLFPVGDTVRSVSPWWFNSDLKCKQRWFPAGGMDSEVGWACRLSRNMEQLRQLIKAGMATRSPAGQFLPSTRSLEPHIPFINAVVNNEPTRLVLNVQNLGTLKGIPDDVFVEIPCVVQGENILYEKIEPLPKRLMLYVMIPRWLKMERTLQAFIEGDRASLILSLMEDPRTSSFDQAVQVVEKLLTQPWNEEAERHYRTGLQDYAQWTNFPSWP